VAADVTSQFVSSLSNSATPATSWLIADNDAGVGVMGRER
jgi:hypothetical protein